MSKASGRPRDENITLRLHVLGTVACLTISVYEALPGNVTGSRRISRLFSCFFPLFLGRASVVWNGYEASSLSIVWRVGFAHASESVLDELFLTWSTLGTYLAGSCSLRLNEVLKIYLKMSCSENSSAMDIHKPRDGVRKAQTQVEACEPLSL